MSNCSACSAVTSVLRDPYVLSSSVALSYLLLYTGYDKAEQAIVPSLWVDLFLVRKGWDWTLKELNKAISLSGLTCMLMAFLPEFEPIQRDLLWISMNKLWIHSLYSYYKFYDLSLVKVWKDKAIKTLSVVLGAAGQLALSLGYWGQITPSSLLLSATTLGIGHFWTMEVDYKYKLQVRPYAYLPFPLGGYALYKYFTPK
jgi:hypothetical protein